LRGGRIASELAARLAAVNPQKLVVERTIFPGEARITPSQYDSFIIPPGDAQLQ
jgi:hypothetical protein